MNISIVVARDESGKIANLYLGEDAQAAKDLFDENTLPGLFSKEGLSGTVKVEMYRRPMSFKRRECVIEAAAKKSKSK